MTTLVFGYGSLMNPESVHRTLPNAKLLERVVLNGYQRKANAVSNRFPDVAMNIIPNSEMSVTGVLLEVNDSDMPALHEREFGYEMVDVSKSISPTQEKPVYTFISPDVSDCQGKKVYQAYLDICLEGVPENEREQWLAETIISCELTNECRKELYKGHGI